MPVIIPNSVHVHTHSEPVFPGWAKISMTRCRRGWFVFQQAENTDGGKQKNKKQTTQTDTAPEGRKE